MDILISIIIPIYKVEKYLDRCIKSVQQQTYKNLDIILVEDGSPDKCGEICEKYAKDDSRIQVIHKKNEGLGLARNTGLSFAEGEFVAFVDSDDFIEQKYIEKMYKALLSNGADTAICGLFQYYGDDDIKGKPISSQLQLYENKQIIEEVLMPMIGGTPSDRKEVPMTVSVWHELYSMSIIKKYNILFPSEREFISEDIIFQIDYFKRANKVVVIPDQLYYYFRLHEESLSSSYRENRFEKEKILIQEIDRKLKEFIDEEIYRERLQRLFLGRTRTCLQMELANSQEEKFKEIIHDPLLQKMFNGYPYYKNPWKLKVFNFFLKRRNTKAIKQLINMKNVNSI